MSDTSVKDTENDCSNDLLLLDRVFLRLGNADTDEQLESCLNRFLPPVILKLSSPHEQVRTKVFELLVHVNKRVKCRSEVQLPVQTLLQLYKDPKSNSFIINFSIIYITMGFPRLSRSDQINLAPSLLEAVEDKPQGHLDGILMLIMPLLGDIKVENLNLKEKPKLSGLIVKFATDILLLPYRALPSNNEERDEFQVPPGMSMKSYKRIVEKNILNATQLEEMKLSVVNFITKDIFNDNQILLPLIVAAADSRFNIANQANSPLIRVANSVDWSSASVISPLYSLYLGTWSGLKLPAEDRRVAACTRLRLKLIQYLNKATGPAIMFPHCVQVVFSSLFDANTNSRLRNFVLTFLLNVINNGDGTQLNKVATVFLQGILKLTRSEEYSDHHSKAFTCLGRLVSKCPKCINKQFTILEELVNKIPIAPPEMKTALRDALLEMASAYEVASNDTVTQHEAPDVQQPSTSGKIEKMDVDEIQSHEKSFDEPQALALFAILDHYMLSDDSMIRYIAVRYAAVVFPHKYIPAKYLLLLASGDSQDEISTEALKFLYGKSRISEIQDVVNNATKKDPSTVNIDQDAADASKKKNNETSNDSTPGFHEMVNYLWEQSEKRKKGSNAKHRFVINNHVLPFHPATYQEILRYLKMCLNCDACLKDCSDHPNATSPVLAEYIRNNLLDTEVLEKYLNLIVSLLTAVPDVMPLTCFLDIVGCIPEKISLKYTNQLPFFKNLFCNSTKEEIRETAATIYAIITVNTFEKGAIEREILDFVEQSGKNIPLESQCGYASAFSLLCERCVHLCKKGKRFGGKGFNITDWEAYKASATAIVKFLTSSQNILVSMACTNLALLARCTSLPFPNISSEDEAVINADILSEVLQGNDSEQINGTITKFTVVKHLFKVVNNGKMSSKMKEKAIYALGVLCCGERFPFSKHIMKGFIEIAKDSKDLEIHLEIGSSLVLCVEGVNSNENRDLWVDLPVQGGAKLKCAVALEENDALLEWLLQELFKLGKLPHPHSRQATAIWLLSLLKNCPEREPICQNLQKLQDNFMDFLSENSEIVQDVASKGLSLVYQNSSDEKRQALVLQIIDQLTSGRRSVVQVTDDTKIFEEGQLGKAPTGGNLSTYKELCSLASDLNQPDLLYKFMHLAHHNSIWNSKKGAAFGFHSIALQAGAQLSEHLPKIVPRLYRYRFDPTPRIQNSMSSIWSALVPETQKIVHKYHKEILDDLVTNLTSNQWRVRMSSCNALADLLKGAKSLHDSLYQLPTVWSQLFRVMDDVHEGTRQSAVATASVLSKLCIKASDVSQGKDGREIVSTILPVLLENGITNVVKEVRSVSLLTVSKLVVAAGETLKQFLPTLIPALVTAAGELESSKLSYLSTVLGTDSGTREVVDDIRATAARHHYTTDTVVKCMPFIDLQVMTDMLPKMLELTKSPQLGTKIAACHFFVLATHHLRRELEPLAGKIMSNLLNGTLDRNSTVRKNYAEALGQVTACAKDTSVEKLMKKLVLWYETKEDEITTSAIALTLKAIAKAKAELIKDHEEIIISMVFLAKHASKDGDSNTVEIFEEIWIDISPGRETGIRKNLTVICNELEKALNSRNWSRKIQAANAIKTICNELSSGLGSEREKMIRALLAAAHGKTFEGKHHMLDTLSELCNVKDGENPVSSSLAEDCLNALLVECRKQDLSYRRHAISALGVMLTALRCDRFHQVYEIVKGILLKDESSVGKDSDEEDNEGARLRREQLIALKEAAYELLGKAWPRDPKTQETYQEVFFEHCSHYYPSCSRSTQLAIMTAVSKVLEKLQVLKVADESMVIDNEVGSDKRLIVSNIVEHVITIVKYTLTNSNQTRLRRDALGIMATLGKQLKDLNYCDDLDKLKNIFNVHSPDLTKDTSYEIRVKLDELKAQFK